MLRALRAKHSIPVSQLSGEIALLVFVAAAECIALLAADNHIALILQREIEIENQPLSITFDGRPRTVNNASA